MPKKRGKENKDPDFVPGKSRRSGYYNPNRDDRNVSKELERLKGEWGKKLGLSWWAKLRTN